MKKKILVSGGTGFIGYHIVKKCIALKWSVAILSSRKPNKLRYIKNVEYIRCNVTKKKDIQLNFDLALLRLFELEHSHEILLKTKVRNCSNHSSEINRNCFECSLINIIP